MGAFKSRAKYMDNVSIASGDKCTHPSKKHYRPDHRKINQKMEYYDNDIMWVMMETDLEGIEIEFGINKNRWKFSDCDGNDENKDGNKG